MLSDRERLLRDVQAKSFLAHDILLYLDTHPEDRRAFEVYQRALEDRREAMAAYEQQVRALQTDSQRCRSDFDWVDGDYPWQ